MPKVQSYTPGQVKPNPLPASRYSANADADSFGGGNAAILNQLGKGLQSTGSDLMSVASKYGQELGEIKDKAVARERVNALDMQALTYTSSQYELKGEPATKALSEGQKWFSKALAEGIKDLTPRQKEYVMASFSGTMQDHLGRLATFSVKATEDYEKTTILGQNQTAVDEAVALRTDPYAIQKSMRTIAVNTNALMRGQHPDAKKAALSEAMDNLHSKVLSAITLDSPVAAQGYLEANKKYFRDYDAKKKDLDEKAFDFTVRMKAVEMSNSGLSLEDQLKEADKIQDPKMADELRKRVKEKYEDKKLAKESADAEALKAEWQKMITDPKGYQIPYERLQKNEWQAMESFKKAKLNGFALTSDTGPLMKYGLMTDAELKAVPISEIGALTKDLKEEDWKAVFGRYQALRGGKGAGEVSEHLTQIRTDMETLKGALRGIGVEKTDKGSGAVALEKLHRVYQSELSQEEMKAGRKMTPTEKQQIVDDLFVKGKVGFFGWEKRVFEMGADEWKSFRTDVPKEEQVKIVEAMNRAGIPVTKAAVQKAYTAKLESRRK